MTLWNSLPGIIKFARLLSVLLIAVFVVYIFSASAMILGSGEELFPKMTLSFVALVALAAATASTWRWELAGSLLSLVALIAYRYAEFLRVGYWRVGIFSYGVVLIVLIYLYDVTFRKRSLQNT